MRSEERIAVIGAGWAGCAAAVELADAGLPVTLFEPARRLGGRARSVAQGQRQLDNGQHLLLGAYRETLRLMEKVGVDNNGVWRAPLRLHYPGGFDLSLPDLRAPWQLALGLLSAKGLSLLDKWRAARFIRALEGSQFQLERDMSMAHLLARHHQSDPLTRRLWEPLCLAALNTPIQRASAQVFCNVLRDGLCGSERDSDLIIPRRDLSALFPEPALRFLQQRGGQLRPAAVRHLRRTERGYRLELDEGAEEFSAVICAVPPWRLAELLDTLPEMRPACAMASALEYEPIATLTLQYPGSVPLPFPMVGLDHGHGQWAFDLETLRGEKGLVSVVISAGGPHLDLEQEQLARSVHGQLARITPLPDPSGHQVIVERRATFACTVGVRRPDALTPLPGLFLAGDYTAGDYPATLEGAVRSGVKCAALLRSSLKTLI